MWEEIDGFASPQEYSRFVAYIDQQVKLGFAQEAPYDAAYGIIQMDGERWFKNLATGEVWKLLVPDPGYFRGAWVPVRRDADVS